MGLADNGFILVLTVIEWSHAEVQGADLGIFKRGKGGGVLLQNV